MAYSRGEILGIAQSWIGKKKADNTYKSIIDIYNTIKPLPRGYKVSYNDAWGTVFISAVFQKANYSQLLPLECSWYYMSEAAKQQGIWQNSYTYMPKPGDIMMYDYTFNKTTTQNVLGIVESAISGLITVIGGYYDNEVQRRTIAVGKNIKGFITPKYDAETTEADISTGTKLKYSETNPVLKIPMTQSTWYSGSRAVKAAKNDSKPVGILWHDTSGGNPFLSRYVQPDDSAKNRAEMLSLLGKNKYGNDWNHINHTAGLNAWVGKLADGSVTSVQVGEWEMCPWGCGSGKYGSCNGYITKKGKNDWLGEHWIQFELCDDGYVSSEYFAAIYEEACQLTAFLCKKYNIDPKGTHKFNGVSVPTILCHADSYKYGVGNNHGDVYPWFNKFGKTMEDVRNDVAKLLSAGEKEEPKKENKPIKKGDIVTFIGNTHYPSSSAPVGYSCKPGEATVFNISPGTAHPYSLIRTTLSSSTVYGWVNEKDIVK